MAALRRIASGALGVGEHLDAVARGEEHRPPRARRAPQSRERTPASASAPERQPLAHLDGSRPVREPDDDDHSAATGTAGSAVRQGRGHHQHGEAEAGDGAVRRAPPAPPRRRAQKKDAGEEDHDA